MFRRVSFKIILSIFFSLLIIVAITVIVDSQKGERTFRGDLIEVNQDEITQIQIFPKVLDGKLVTLIKESDKWKVEFNGNKYNANESLPGSMISELNSIKPESVAATQKEKWAQYEVNDSLATRVKLLNNKNVVADIYIGKFSFSQPRNLTSYIRMAEDKEVYGVNGFLSMTFNRELKSFRDQSVIKQGSSDWTKLTFTNPADGEFTLNKVNEKWFVNQQPADSTLVAGYLTGISNLSNSELTDPGPLGSPIYSLLIEGNNLMNPIRINGYLLHQDIIVESNLNQNTYFNSNELAGKIFISRDKLLKQ